MGRPFRWSLLPVRPLDARTACIAVIDAELGTAEIVAQYRPLAAPVVFVCGRLGLEWWQQTSNAPVRRGSPIPPDGLASFFTAHSGEFAPDAIYRAKTWGRFDTQYQMSFVDLGLMPLVEEEIGQELTTLVSREVQKLKSLLDWATFSEKQGQWLLKSVFWVVSAKILRDKEVARFGTLDLLDVESVLDAVAKHFDAERISSKSERQRKALAEIAADVNRFSNLRLATTESLAHVYENALISKATRQALGTHSTPSYLVDYVVGKTDAMDTGIPLEGSKRLRAGLRTCGFPSIGDAAADGALTESEVIGGSATQLPTKSHSRLRQGRLRARDREALAQPYRHPEPGRLGLGSPAICSRETVWRRGRAPRPFSLRIHHSRTSATSRAVGTGSAASNCGHINKTTELLARVLPELPRGAVLGVVVPQGFLHSKNAASVRRLLTTGFEIQEICLFPDKVFTFSDMESAVLIARKKNDQMQTSTT